VFRGNSDAAPGDAGAGGGCAQVMGDPPPQVIGKIQTATGLVTVMDARGVVAQVKVGGPVCLHDTIETGADGAVGITFTDGTAFNLLNNARMALNEFVCGPNGTSNSALFSLNQGAFNFTAGKVAKSGGLTIDTPVARIRSTSQGRGIGALTLAALTFPVMDEIQAASWPDAFLDDDAVAYKDLAHGSYEIVMKSDGRVIRHEDPGETIVVNPTGEVTRIPNSSSRMAELQGAQQAALATLSLGLGQGAAPGGSSTETFNGPQGFQPIKFSLDENHAGAGIVAGIISATSSGVIEVPQLQVKPPPPTLSADAGLHTAIEIPHVTASTGFDTASSATLTFTELKFSTLSVSLASISWSGGDSNALPGGLRAALAPALTTSVNSAGSTGSITATFSAADSNFDFLADGETLTIVYNVTVTDTNGNSVTQPVTIAITGTNDAPALAADASGPHMVSEGLTTTGTLTFTDVDLNDHHAVSTTAPTFALLGGTLTAAQLAALTAASTLTLSEADSTGSGSGSIAVTFSAADSAFDFLADGQTLTVTYDVTVTDNNGVSSTQPVKITVIGTNDAPVITSAAQSGAVIEHTNIDNSGNLNAGGTITFADVDLTDKHTVTFTPGGNNYLGTFTPTLAHDATGGSTGIVGWTFSVSDKAVDFLAAGQTLTQTYTVQIADGNGGFTTQDVTITIIGTNDAPVVSTTSNAFTELAGTTNNATPDTVSGTISFTDVDLTDRPLASAAFSSFTYTDAALHPLTLTPAQQAAVAAVEVPVSVVQAAGNTNNGSATWTYSLADSNFDFLAAGEILTLTYTATVNDGHGGVVSKPFTVTITGTNDAPVIGGVATGSVTEDVAVDSSGNLTTGGTLTITDADHGQSSFTPQTTSGSNGYGTFTLAADGTWTYTANDSQTAIQQLNTGQSVTDSFIAVSSDGTASQLVTVTIHGTDDAFVIAPGTVFVLKGGTLPYPLIENDGTIETGSNNTSNILGTVTGTGLLEITNNTTLRLEGPVGSGQTVQFGRDVGGGANAELVLDDPSHFQAPITNFLGNDEIVLSTMSYSGTTPTTLSASNPTATVGNETFALSISATFTTITVSEGTQTASLTLLGDYTGHSFTFSSDPIFGGTSIVDPLTIDSGATREIQGASTDNVLFVNNAGNTGTLVLDDPIAPSGLISGFTGTSTISDAIDLKGITFDAGTTWNYTLNSAGTGGTLTIYEGTTVVDTINFVGNYTTANFTVQSDGNGGTLITDPPASTTTAEASTTTTDASTTPTDASTATTDASTTTTDASVIPVVQAPTLTAPEPASIRRNVAAAAADEAIMVAFSTAVAVALSAAASDADAGEMPSLAISGNDTAVDITDTVSGLDSPTVNSDAALELSPISDRMAGTLTDNGTVEVINGTPAGAVSETGALKIDAAAALQLEGSDAVNELVITDGTNADAITLPGDHTTKTARHISDDGHGGKTAHNAPASETGEDTPAQSTSADNHFSVSSPFTEMPSGNGDHSASAFKPSVDHDATVDPGVNLASVPKDQLLQHPADNLIHIRAQPDHGADPAHPHVDGNQSANAKFADVGGDHSAHANDEYTPVQSAPTNNGHHWGADPETNVASIPQNHAQERPADNSSHVQQDDDGSPAVTDGAHPGRGQGDRSEPASPKFADVAGEHSAHANDEDPSVPLIPANNGHHWGADPEINVASIPQNHAQERPADNSSHVQQDDDGSPAVTDGAHPGRGQGDRSEPASPKFADNGSPQSAHATGEDTSVPSALADNGHHGNADPKNNDIAKDLPPQHAADDSSHMQHDDEGSPAATDGAHPGRGQVDGSESASPNFADNGSPQSAHATGEDTSVPSALADNGHHPIADADINLASIAPNQPPEYPADNLPPPPAQPDDGPHPADPSVDVNEVSSFKFADNGSDHGTGPDGAHPAHPQIDGNQSDSFKFADGGDRPGTITNDSTAVTAPSNDSSGTHGPAAPTLATPFDVPGTVMSAAPDQFVFADNDGHGPIADHKPDVIEIDQTVPADIQHVLDSAHDTNAVSTLDPSPATAPQDITKVQLPHQGDFHFV
jgi:VCBS repeat-containing protein